LSQSASSREVLLSRTLVQLTDTLVEGFDVIDLFTLLTTRCVEILDVSVACLLLPQANDRLGIAASSSEAKYVLEVLEAQSDEGPGPDCYRSGQTHVAADLTTSYEKWPRFAPRAVEAGFRAVLALPMRLRGQTIGVLSLFKVSEGLMDEGDMNAAQSLADIASIAIVHHRADLDLRVLNDQLRQALNSRIVIEQAKGVVSERLGVDMTEAFSLLRTYARNNGRLLSEVARDVVDDTLHPNPFRQLPIQATRDLGTARAESEDP